MPCFLPTAYFPNLAYLSLLIVENDAQIEVWDTYHKQTFRNRCNVMTANGLQTLVVPVIKPNGNHTMTRDIRISYAEPWQQIHMRCLCSAYKKSVYYDYYFPYLSKIFETHYDSLIDLNDNILATIGKLLKTQINIEHTEDFVKDSVNDYRDFLNEKHGTSNIDLPHYYQVFEDRYPFANNLSILDLLFNKGPESLSYLQLIAPIVKSAAKNTE